MSWQLAILIHQLPETVFALVYRKHARKHPKDHIITVALMYVMVIIPFGVM